MSKKATYYVTIPLAVEVYATIEAEEGLSEDGLWGLIYEDCCDFSDHVVDVRNAKTGIAFPLGSVEAFQSSRQGNVDYVGMEFGVDETEVHDEE